MKILIVSQYFWPENFSINKIASYLASQGHEVDVLTGIPNYPQGVFYEGYGLNKKRNETYEGVNIKRVWIKPRGKKGGDPQYLKNLDINLILSGHAHGGQWRIGNRGIYAPGQGWFPEYSRGVYDGRLVVSAGVSNTTWIPRFFNPREIVVVEV